MCLMWYSDPEHQNPISYYHKSTQRAIYAVLSFFKDVNIVRTRKGEQYGYLVPLRYEGKDVYIQYRQTPEKKKNRDVGEVLPAMSLGMPYPPQPFRESGIVGDPKFRHILTGEQGESIQMLSGRPFIIDFELTLRANLMHELYNMYEMIMSRLWRGPVSIPILETDMEIKRDVYLGNISSRWGEYNPVFEKGSNSRPSEIIISFQAGPIFYYPPIEDASGIIKHIELDYINMDFPDNSFVVDFWDVDPPTADEEDPHDEVLTQNLFGETYEWNRIEVNKDE